MWIVQYGPDVRPSFSRTKVCNAVGPSSCFPADYLQCVLCVMAVQTQASRGSFGGGELCSVQPLRGEERMALEHWNREMSDGDTAEYFYNQTPLLCWASKKVGSRLETRDPAPRGLTHKQVEALFDSTPA